RRDATGPGRSPTRARWLQGAAADLSRSAGVRGADFADLAEPRSAHANDDVRDRPAAASRGALSGGVRADPAAVAWAAQAVAADRGPGGAGGTAAGRAGGGRQGALPAREARGGRRHEGGGARRAAGRGDRGAEPGSRGAGWVAGAGSAGGAARGQVKHGSHSRTTRTTSAGNRVRMI